MKKHIIEELSDVELFSKREKGELAFCIITSGLIDPGRALKTLDCPTSIETIMDAGQQAAAKENPICEQIDSVSSEEIRAYVNEIMAEVI